MLLGVFIPPLGGAIIGDYLFVWRGELPDFDAIRLPVIRYSCTAAYVLGTLVAYMTAEAGIGVPPLHGVLIAGLAVPLFERALRAAGIDQLAHATDVQVAQ
ncbi:hypothetical protein BH23ACT10_BH23ACT10_33060 [soil metagenome]